MQGEDDEVFHRSRGSRRIDANGGDGGIHASRDDKGIHGNDNGDHLPRYSR